MKNREMLMNGKKHSITEERQGYKVFMTLIIHNILRRDIGTYTCVATNSLGKVNGTIRLYEIKLQTRPPTTTVEAKTTEKETTTITYPTTTTTTSIMEVTAPMMEIPLNNYLPSVEPAPLETIMSGRSSSLFPFSWSYCIILSLLITNR
ncbi:hypothetical protein ILUMI_05589 [Ignelater luminosus]|uniref:Immunoglobulin I-set domain-containing protein n=1 Tax=Ignelater luminosus TaxID=2038154 RepID=A0A8K0DHD8_IGNLU|nr:hypothetical protein ILUMI_05589 [Ignelater luminosus]